jgi:hypothetical protein
MTRTEERLREYFGAVADTVRAGNTRPLAPPRPHERRRAKALFRHRGWQTWGVPLAAAASVLAVVSLAMALAGPTTGYRSAAPPMSGATTTPPRYYAEVDGSATGGSVVIMSTSSGAVIARVQKSALLRDSAPSAEPGLVNAVAAAPDDRTFYVEVLMADEQVLIVKFRVNGPGLVSGIARIGDGVLNGGYASGNPSLAVSPDGRSLALTTTSSAALAAISGHGGVPAVQDEIVVIDLRSGAHRTWRGGLYKTGTSFDIQDLSWADHGRSLVFVPAWCPGAIGDGCPYHVSGGGYSQVRQLSVSGVGGSLAGSRVLLGAAGYVQEAISDQDGKLDVLKLSGPESEQYLPMTVTVEQFSASGALRGVLYQHAYQGHPFRDYLIGIYLSADPSGMYLLLGLEFDVSTAPNEVGWINQGVLRVLKVGKDVAELLPDAW